MIYQSQDASAPPLEQSPQCCIPAFQLLRLAASIAISLSGSLTAFPLLAWADQTPNYVLLAQQIVDGLPPPPALPTILQPVQPSQAPQRLRSNPGAGSQATPRGALVEHYLVLVNGDSPLLLDQVRKVESEAFLQEYDGRQVIQAGLFSEASSANQQAEALEAQGIGAEVVSVSTETTLAARSQNANYAPSELPPLDLLPVAPVSEEIFFGQPPSLNDPVDYDADFELAQAGTNANPDNAFYVAIPAPSNQLDDIAIRVTQLAAGLSVSESNILERRSPRGPHVLVGPFVDRSTAFRWSRYLRAFGMPDARVYYKD